MLDLASARGPLWEGLLKPWFMLFSSVTSDRSLDLGAAAVETPVSRDNRSLSGAYCEPSARDPRPGV